MQKNVFKILGIITIVAALTMLVVACGPGGEPTPPKHTVTFDSDGGTDVSPKTVQVEDGALVTKPGDPTKVDVATPGLYKNWPAAGYVFDGWVNSAGADYDFSTPVIADITIKAKWKIPDGVAVDLSSQTASDIVSQTFNYLNAQKNTASPPVSTLVATDKYTLFIDSKITPAKVLTLTNANANLTIIGKDNNTSEIKSPDLSTVDASTAAKTNDNVFILLGTLDNPTTTVAPTPVKNVSLTLKNVAVVGAKDAAGIPVQTPNSLIRVINGATLTLDEKAYIADHINSAGTNGGTVATTGSGTKGNGAAICVINGSTLNIKQSAIVTNNKSTGNQANKNLVGGIFVIGSPAASSANNKNNSIVNIEGGDISGNDCEDGNTKDIYITETVELNLQGNVTIGELCINADDLAGIASTTVSNFTYPAFTIKGPVTNTIKKFNLRSTKTGTSALTNVENAWKDKKVFSGTADYDIKDSDVAQFKLWEFTGQQSLRGTSATADENTWENLITKKYGIQIVEKSGTGTSAVPNYGKLVAKSTP